MNCARRKNMDEAKKILAALDDPGLTIGGLKELARQAVALAGRMACLADSPSGEAAGRRAGELEALRDTPPGQAQGPAPTRGEAVLTFCAQLEGGEVIVGKNIFTENETGWLDVASGIVAMMFIAPWGKFGPFRGYAAYNFMALSEASVNSGRSRLTGVQILGLRKDGKVDVHRIHLLPQVETVETMKINQGDKIIEIPFRDAWANWKLGSP